MLAVVALVATMLVLAALTFGTEELDRRQSRRLLRRASGERFPVDVTERIVAEECARLLARAE